MAKLLHIVAACAENRVIGREGKLPWRIREDSKRFRQLTVGGVCIFGRVCFDTWSRATRGGRQAIVVTHRPLEPRPVKPRSGPAKARSDPNAPRLPVFPPLTAPSFEAALALAESLPGEVFACGGQQIFEEALALDRPMLLHLTLVHAEVPGDRYFPDWQRLSWREISRQDNADANYRYTFLTLERDLSVETKDAKSPNSK